MLLFVFYAVGTWYFVVKNRRSIRGTAWLVASIAGLALVAWLHYKLQTRTSFDIYLPVLQVILYPYIAMVAMVGGFLLSLPRPGCRVCGYDRVGLAEEALCPECGTTPEQASTAKGRRAARQRHAQRSARRPEPRAGIDLSAHQREHHPGEQHARGQPEPAPQA